MPPNRNCHIQAHVAFTAWSQSAVPEGQENSTRLQSVRNRVMLPLSWSLATLCPLCSLIACSRECRVVRWWPTIDPYHEPLASSMRFLCQTLRYQVHVWLCRQGHPGLQLPQQRLARGTLKGGTALGGLQNTKEARVLSRLWWPTRWHLGMAPSMATWQLCS